MSQKADLNSYKNLMWLTYKKVFERQIQFVVDFLTLAFRKEIEDQGHSNTGKLKNSIEGEIVYVADTIIIQFLAEDYGIIVDQGVEAERIPFGGTKPKGQGGGKSDYIQGLIDFFKLKGLTEKLALGAAIATAKVHKFGKNGRDGMPTRGSFAYTNNGRRLNWINATISDNESKIFKLVETATNALYESTFTDMIARQQIKLR